MLTAKCNLQRTWYFFSSKYKAVIQIGTLGCSHALVSVVLIVERGWGVGSTTIFSMLFSQQCFKLMYYKEFVVRFVFCQKTGTAVAQIHV